MPKEEQRIKKFYGKIEIILLDHLKCANEILNSNNSIAT